MFVIWDVNALPMLFYIIYTNYNQKLQAEIRKPKIPWDKYKGLALRGDPQISQEGKKRENEMLVCICFGTSKLILMLSTNLGICL